VVATDWQISGLNLKITPKSEVFAPWAPPRKEVSTFLIYHCKGKVFTNIFYAESLFPMCLV